MRVVAVIQARLSSQRLPGKVLRPLRGRPMLAHLVAALRHSRGIDGMVLATSDDLSDDALEEFAAMEKLSCFRGSLDNVAGRLLAASLRERADAFVRVNGDSPLLDPRIVDRGVVLFRESWPDLVTNVFPRSFPKGQSVEVVQVGALQKVLAGPTTDAEREHVTRHFYDHPERFDIRSFSASTPRPELQLSVDSPADFAQCERVLDALGEPAWQAGWERCVAAADATATGAGSAPS